MKNQNCRSQKTCQLQKDCGIHSTLGGLSLQGLSSGPVIGFSVNPRTVQNIKKGMAKTHSDNVSKQLQQVLTVSKYIILNYTSTITTGPFLSCLSTASMLLLVHRVSTCKFFWDTSCQLLDDNACMEL